MKILYKFASRSRKQKFFACIDNIEIMSFNKNFTILASLDIDDPAMNTPDTIASLRKYERVLPVFSISKNKVDAINRDMSSVKDWDILINMSDDMMFIEPGFDKIIEEAMQKFYPDGDCLLHFPDQHQGINCMTMSIMDRKYYDRFGFIYHPDYASLECDMEAMEVGQRLGRYRFIDKRIFNHYHPSFGDTAYDEQYNKTEGRIDPSIRQKDKQTFLNRKKNHFYLTQH